MRRTILALPLKRASRFGGAYALYLAIVWLFDYIYFPWLTIKFHSLVYVPLFLSVFLVSWGGYYLYEYFQEDVFFTEKINGWLARPGTGRIRGKLKRLIASNPRCTFAAISTWWSPLHAYVFFRRDETFEFTSFIKALATGSFFCAVFWGTVGESFLISWHLFRTLLHRI
jgi:hypothetical protein